MTGNHASLSFAEQHIRKPQTSFWLCFFLGGMGGHYYYLGEYAKGALSTLLCWTGIPLLISLSRLHTVEEKTERLNLRNALEMTAV